VIALSIGGTVQGLDWVHKVPFIQSVVDMEPYYLWRGVGGILMFLSHVVFAWNVWRMTAGHPGDAASPVMDPSAGKEIVGKEVVA
jgi:cytochrome c oxidase cbb3-type subunit 1